MKGRITLGIYVAIGITGAAFGQQSTHVKTTASPFSVEALTRDGKPQPIPPGWAPAKTITTIAIAPPPPPSSSSPLTLSIVISYGRGGRLDDHNLRFGAFKRDKAKVELRGPCYSACTLLTAYVSKDDLCIAEGAFLAFHAARSAEIRQIMPVETAFMYQQQPEVIRGWIDRTGGHQNLPLDGFWYLRDSDLWAMGYPKCK